MSSPKNKRVFLKNRPGADHEPTADNFCCVECDVPGTLPTGEITIQTMYLSLDPAMRCRMNDTTGVEYMKEWQLGETVLGLGGVGQVTRSNHPGFAEGDIVQSAMNWPWVKYFNTKPDDNMSPVLKVDAAFKDSPQIVLCLLGITGLTSYLGVKEKGHVTPGGNQTFVVNAAAGACGNLAGQIGKLLGAHQVIGICGSDSKCDYLTSDLGFDASINYKTQNICDRLRETCPEGVHAYFDNVGGSLSEQVIKHMCADSHVILCGQIAVYNKDVPYPPLISEETQIVIKERNITRERFLVLNFQDKFPEGLHQLQEWYTSGQLKVPEYIHEGLENAAEAFVNMMTSVKQEKVGKQMVHVS